MGIFNRRRASARAEPGRAPAERLSFGPMRMADWRANTSEAICAAAARTANTLASAPLHLYKNEEVQRTHPLERLVRYSPAPGWNAFAFVRDMEFSRSSVGRCYSWVLRDSLRQPIQLQYLDAGRVQTLRALETGDLWHRVTLEDGRDGYIHDSDMLALSWLSTSGAITPTSVLRGTLAYSLNARNTPTLVLEMGVGMRITQEYGEQLAEGFFNLMRRAGAWTGPVAPVRRPIVSTDGQVSFLNAEAAGLFVPVARHDHGVKKDQLIGNILDPADGTVLQELRSPVDGLLFTLREYPIVYPGSLIARVLGMNGEA